MFCTFGADLFVLKTGCGGSSTPSPGEHARGAREEEIRRELFCSAQLREDPDGVLRAMRERESSREAHGPHLAFPGGAKGRGAALAIRAQIDKL